MAIDIDPGVTTNAVLSKRTGEYSYVRINGTDMRAGHNVTITYQATTWTGSAVEDGQNNRFLVARVRHDAREMTKEPVRKRTTAPVIVQVTVTDANNPNDTDSDEISVVIVQ